MKLPINLFKMQNMVPDATVYLCILEQDKVVYWCEFSHQLYGLMTVIC